MEPIHNNFSFKSHPRLKIHWHSLGRYTNRQAPNNYLVKEREEDQKLNYHSRVHNQIKNTHPSGGIDRYPCVPIPVHVMSISLFLQLPELEGINLSRQLPVSLLQIYRHLNRKRFLVSVGRFTIKYLVYN